MPLDKLIAELGKEMSLENPISKSKEGYYELFFEPDIHIQAAEREKNYLLKGVIAPFPKQNTEAFLLHAMEANLFGMGTRGAAIGLEEEGKLLTLSLEVNYDSTFNAFKEKLEDFVSVISFWKQEAEKPQN